MKRTFVTYFQTRRKKDFQSMCFGMTVILLLCACSSTENLPEDEILYTGIRSINYDKAPSEQEQPDTTRQGVITAISDAYDKVEDMLKGNPDKKALKKNIEQEKKLRSRQDLKAYQDTKEEIEAVLSYAPNGSILGSSSMRYPWAGRLGIYNKYKHSTSRFGKWMFNTFGSSPKFISTANPSMRTQIARNTLRNYGYFLGTTGYEIIPDKKPQTAKVSYEIHPGPLYHLDTIRYQMFPPVKDSLILATAEKSALKSGMPFNVKTLEEERQRLSTLFRNNGYYYYQPQYIDFRADTIQRPLFVQLQVRPKTSTPEEANKQFYIGKTFVTVRRNNEFQTTDTLELNDFSMAYKGPGRPPLKPNALKRYLFYKKGDLYQYRRQSMIQELISGMGIFQSLRMSYIPKDESPECDTLDVHIMAILDKPYDAAFEGKVTSKSNGQVGPGVSFTMARKNALRAGETIELNAWGSYEWQTGSNRKSGSGLLNSYEYGASLDLEYPRFMFMGLGRGINRKTFSTTKFLIDAKWMNRAGYFGRVSIGTRVTYTFQKNRRIRHELTPLRLSYEVKLNSTERYDSIVQANQALYVSTRNQFVPSMEYTFNWKSDRTDKHTLMLNVKEAGNITSAIYAMAGQEFKTRDKHLFSVPFAQFLKFYGQYTRKVRLTQRSQLVGRIGAGIIYSYGNSTMAPYNDLFSIGGANSIRAFSARSIGPGSYHPANSSYSYINETGDIKLEANLEYRFPIIAALYGAVFLDAGNVWLRKCNDDMPGGEFKFKNLGRELALGTGVGLRYDLDFLVIRFDLGIGLHAPYETGKSGYYNMTSFGKSLGYHLAIGYPF